MLPERSARNSVVSDEMAAISFISFSTLLICRVTLDSRSPNATKLYTGIGTYVYQ